MIQELISKCFSNWKTRCLVLREVQMFIQEGKAVRWKNLPCELSYYVSGLHILRMDTCHTAFNFKVYECCCVSVVNSPELEWERRGTSRTILLPFSSYHRCPSSKIRPSKPVSPQLLSELYHIRFFFSVSSRLTKTNFGFCSRVLNLGLSSFLGPSVPIHGLQTHVLLSHHKSKVKDFFPLWYSLHYNSIQAKPSIHKMKVYICISPLRKFSVHVSLSADTVWKGGWACFCTHATPI